MALAEIVHVNSKCKKNEPVNAPTAGGFVDRHPKHTERENAKGRNKSDSLNRTPPRTSGCSANNLQADHVQTERVAIM